MFALLFVGHCALTQPWEALVIGCVGAVLTLGTIELLDKINVDDPVGEAPLFCLVTQAYCTMHCNTAQHNATHHNCLWSPWNSTFDCDIISEQSSWIFEWIQKSLPSSIWILCPSMRWFTQNISIILCSVSLRQWHHNCINYPCLPCEGSISQERSRS